MSEKSRYRNLISPRFRVKFYVWRKAGFGMILLNWLVSLLRRGARPPFSLHFTSNIIQAGNIKFSADPTTLKSFAVSGQCYFQANNGIELGRNCLFAPGVKFISSNHGLMDRKKENAPPIRIGDDVWIGAGAIILPGVQLGDRCTVGAGSVVTKSFPEQGLVIAGNPAKVIRTVRPRA